MCIYPCIRADDHGASLPYNAPSRCLRLPAGMAETYGSSWYRYGCQLQLLPPQLQPDHSVTGSRAPPLQLARTRAVAVLVLGIPRRA